MKSEQRVKYNLTFEETRKKFHNRRLKKHEIL